MSMIVQWELATSAPTLTNGVTVGLVNQHEGKSLRFGERENGIELVWDEATDLRNVSFRTQGQTGNPLTYASAVAIRVDGGGFLTYAERDTGINLTWSAQSRFEWEVTGGVPGTPVSTTLPVALLNTLHGDHLVYGERPEGINLRWYADLPVFGQTFVTGQLVGGYPPLPIPNALRGPGREAAQIQIAGQARTMVLFHGQSDDELDWHLYVSVDPRDRRRLTEHLHHHGRGAGDLTERDLDQLYFELMVLDGWRNPTFDEFFFSSDVGRAFGLDRPAWDESADAGSDQGESQDITGRSVLCRRGASVQLQGCFVNDAAHGFRVEIHPLDSIAYALQGNEPLSITADHPDWPERAVTWRVAVFTNSTFHRIDRADYTRQERVTTWFLDLPKAAIPAVPSGPVVRPGVAFEVPVSFTVVEPGFVNRGQDAEGLDDARPTASARYGRYGVVSAEAAIVVDPSVGRRRLRVQVRMVEPDRWGGMFLAEYHLRAGEQVLDATIGPG